MRTLLSIAFILTSVCLFGSEIDENKVRVDFIEAAKDLDKRASFVEAMESSNSLNASFKEAYLGASLALLAECSYAPWVKFGHFSDGTEMLDKAISSNPQMAEFRYLRFMIQVNAPAFLDYDNEVIQDYRKVTQAIASADAKNQRESWMDHFESFLVKNQSTILARTDITF